MILSYWIYIVKLSVAYCVFFVGYEPLGHGIISTHAFDSFATDFSSFLVGILLHSNMPSWLLLQSEAGFPLFSRSSGLPGAAFSFATTGLLAAAQQAASAGGFILSRLDSHDAAVHARTYPGGLVLILASSDAQCATPESLSSRADRAYDALLFLLGRSKLQDLRHVERTKRQIRSAANLLSLLLLEDSFLLQMGTGIPECCIPTSGAIIFDDLTALASACHTAHAAFYLQHRLYAWTDAFGKLDTRDQFTISCFLRSVTHAQARDVPVYLAHSSLATNGSAAASQPTGRTPYRLLTISLLADLELVLLCGPNPALMDAIAAVQTVILRGVALPYCAPTPGVLAAAPSGALVPGVGPPVGQLSPLLHRLQMCVTDGVRHVPNHFGFFNGILGFMLIVHREENENASNSSNNNGINSKLIRPMRARMVCSFIPSAPTPPAPVPTETDIAAASTSSRSSRGRSPSPSPAGRRSPSPAATSHSTHATEPQSPSTSQFSPSNPLFASSLLSEASVLSRSHALLAFYQLVQPQLFPLPASNEPFRGSRPPSPLMPNHRTSLPSTINISNEELPNDASATTNNNAVEQEHTEVAPTSQEASPAQPAVPSTEQPICTDAYMLTPVSRI
jgi:hypothetical protein